MAEMCSIVVPTRNRRDRLRRTLLTLTAQDYPSVEVIISDDGSTDGTAEMVRALDLPAVRVVRSVEATGVSLARNRGIEAARGRWVGFCDDDDLWCPTKLSRQIAAMGDQGREWSYCSAVRVDDGLEPLGVERALPAEFPGCLAFVNVVPGGCSSVVAARDLVLEVGGFRQPFSMFADWDLWIRLAMAGEPSRVIRPGVLYVQHGDQMSMDMGRIGAELAAFRQLHHEFRGRHRRPSSIEPIDGWISERLRQGGRRGAAVAHSVRSSQGLDFGVVKGIARSIVGPVRHRQVVAAWSDQIDDAVAAVREVLADAGA